MSKQIKVLLVEDSVPDATLIQEVVQEQKIEVQIDVVRDGEAAMAYLSNGKDGKKHPLPELILLDLNLPKKDGREVLAEIKSLPRLKHIPVVVLSMSQAEEDVLRCYSLQASCYVIKPLDFEELTDTIKSIDKFWFSLVKYPCKQ